MITTAAQLWTNWVDSNLLRPKDYDVEIADLVRRGLGDSSLSNAALPQAMDCAGWDARDLIRVMVPVLTSFSGMLTDLLALYERIDATRTHKDNLRISYGFEEGDAIDDQLAPFREKVQRTQTVVREVEAFRFPHEHAWKSPLAERAAELHFGAQHTAENLLGLEVGRAREWPFASEFPTPLVENPLLQHLVMRHRQVIAAALDKLSEFGATTATLRRDLDRSDAGYDLVMQSGDLWWLTEIGIMNLVPDLFAALAPDEATKLMQEQLAWLEKFWNSQTVTIEQQIEDLTDTLALPYWGQRHDLYSAWVAAAMDTALTPGRLKFDVSDGVLAFPFHATLLARIETANGAVELWTEKKFQASGLIGMGRKEHIQPDYVLINSAAPNKVIGVIEAKQYLRADNKNHGEAAHDYARNLSDAEVHIVAHGPLGAKTLDKVAQTDRSRVSLHQHVRPGNVSAIEVFAERLVALLPPHPAPVPDPPAEVDVPKPSKAVFAWWERTNGGTESQASANQLGGTIVLRWAPTVRDLDLHLIDVNTRDVVSYRNRESEHAALGDDGFDGGPEYALFYPTGRAIGIEVHLYSSDVPTVLDAAPVVTITTLGGAMTLRTRPGVGADARVWRVATIEPNGIVVRGDSIDASE